MAIVTSYNGFLSVNAVDLSNHCTSLRVNYGQESREVTSFGDTARVFRTGLATPSIEATFKDDLASGSVNATLRGLVSLTSTGFTVIAKRLNSGTTTVNPSFTLTAVLDGDLLVMNDSVGEVPEISARFVPYSGSLTISTSATA